MPIQPLADATEFPFDGELQSVNAPTNLMATGIFRQADVRYYTRHAFPAEVHSGVAGALAPLTVGDILAWFFAVQAAYVPGADGAGLELQSVTVSLYHMTDPELEATDPLGNVADINYEYECKLLVANANRTYTEQWRLCALEGFQAVQDWFDQQAGNMFMSNGELADVIVSINLSRQRAPRASA